MEEKEGTRPETLVDAFPANSKTTKRVRSSEPAPQKKPEDKKLEKVITGSVVQQKKSFGKRLTETFLDDATKNVKEYIFHDVLIPAAKSMICDMVGWGGMMEMILFGERRGSRTRRDGGQSYVSYNRASYSPFSSTRDRDRDRDRDRGPERDISRGARARHDFDEIVLETRGEAEEVLSMLVDLTIDYGQATVGDLYDLVGIESNFTDNKYGWTDLRNASVNRVRKGYLIDLPKTRLLN